MAFTRVRQAMNTTSTVRAATGLLLAGAVALASAPEAVAQVAIKRTAAGFNLFTIAQDIEVGRQAEAELGSLLHPVQFSRLQRFLSDVTSILALQAPQTGFTFSTTAVTTTTLNALPLPGGSLYISRGVLAVAKSEGEVAGLIAHTMAHVILRHGTERTSRAYLEHAGIGALGGWGAHDRTATRMVRIAGGFGAQSAFLSFAIPDEYEADALGADLMAKAGYDPVAMATMFAALRREQRRHSVLTTFFSSHPAPDDREYRIRNLANVLGHGRAEVVGGFSRSRLRLKASPPSATPIVSASSGSVEPKPSIVVVKVPRPSSRFVRFNHPDSILSIEHPENWNAFPSGVAVSFAPDGGVVEQDRGEPRLVHGMVLNYYASFENTVNRWNNSLTRNYAPFDRSRTRGPLEDATDDLVRMILDINPYLSAPNNSARTETLNGSRGYSVRLRGSSPVTGRVERVIVFTRLLPEDQVVYLACVTPDTYAVAMEGACARMAHSLRVNEAATYRD